MAEEASRRRPPRWRRLSGPLIPIAIDSGRSSTSTGPSTSCVGREGAQLAARPGRRRVAGDDLDLAEERGDPARGRARVDLLRRADLLDHAVAHHRDGLGDAQRLLLVVGDEEGGHPAGRGSRAPPGAGGRAARRRGSRTARRAGSARGSARARGRARRAAAGRRRARAPGALPSPPRPTSSSTSRDPPAVGLAAEAVADVAGDVEVREERVVLEDHADPPLLGRRRSCRARTSVRSPIAISPASGRSSPAISRSVVVLPQPLTVRAARRSTPALDLELDPVDGARRRRRLAQAAQAQRARGCSPRGARCGPRDAPLSESR